MRTILLVGSLALVALAGCVSNPGSPENGGGGDAGDGDLMMPGPYPAANPQLAAHPAYGWPTLAEIAEGRVAAPNAHLLPIPYRPLPETIAGLEHVAKADGVDVGAGIGAIGHYVVVPGWSTGGAVIDLSDPASPQAVGGFDQPARDVDFIIYPDGRVVAVLATDSANVYLLDVSDPTKPEPLATITTLHGSHNVAVVPGTPILYNSNSAGGGPLGDGATEIYDLSDPEEPALVQDWANGYGCHDITFWIDAQADKYRAYCAAIEVTQIWDVADPANPRVVVEVPVHHGVSTLPSLSVPLVLFSHLAMVSHDGSVLIVGDETGGGMAPACDVYVQDPVTGSTASGPVGNLYFYDISSEEDPKLLSFISPTNHITQAPEGADPLAGCTAHFGRLIEDRTILPMAFYGAGVVLIDFSDPANPFILDQWNPGTNTWDVWYYQGYLLTGDLNRGLDVLTLR